MNMIYIFAAITTSLILLYPAIKNMMNARKLYSEIEKGKTESEKDGQDWLGCV